MSSGIGPQALQLPSPPSARPPCLEVPYGPYARRANSPRPAWCSLGRPRNTEFGSSKKVVEGLHPDKASLIRSLRAVVVLHYISVRVCTKNLCSVPICVHHPSG